MKKKETGMRIHKVNITSVQNLEQIIGGANTEGCQAQTSDCQVIITSACITNDSTCQVRTALCCDNV